MRTITLSDGQILQIRETRKEDAAEVIKYLGIISYESDFLTFAPGELNVSLAEEEVVIEECSKAQNKVMLIALVEEKVVACLNFTGHQNSRVAHTGEFGVSVRKDYWNKGIGTAMVEELIQWAHSSKVVRKINLRVRSDNQKAICLYKKLGFVEEGVTTREFLIDGQFFDVLRMGICID